MDLLAIAERSECSRYTGADCRHLVDTAIEKAKEEIKLLPAYITDLQLAKGVGKRRPFDGDGCGTESKKLKVDANGTAVAASSLSDYGDKFETEKLSENYPDGVYAVYNRHFEAALREVKPSVSDKVCGSCLTLSLNRFLIGFAF